MDVRRSCFFGLFLLTLTLCGSTAIVGPAPAHADDVTEWNAIAIDVLALAGQNPVVATRGLAIAYAAALTNLETFMNTPPLPNYPSTHSVLGGAAEVVMSRFFGTDHLSFTITSGPPFAGITRSFMSFSAAQEENGDSRVYSGIHFRSSTVAGILQGEQIGRQAFAQCLQPYRP